jgi:hypothetical protein
MRLIARKSKRGSGFLVGSIEKRPVIIRASGDAFKGWPAHRRSNVAVDWPGCGLVRISLDRPGSAEQIVEWREDTSSGVRDSRGSVFQLTAALRARGCGCARR